MIPIKEETVNADDISIICESRDSSFQGVKRLDIEN